jgi:hypothetical protein
VREVAPLDIVEAIRQALLVRGPDVMVGVAYRSFGDTFTVTPKDNPREKEGPQ